MSWEPWTGCYKVSDGCTYCYFYGPYSKRYGQNTVQKTAEFDKPLIYNTKGVPKIKGGTTVPTCFASDFFIPEADEWRQEAWAMIRQRPDVDFMILTKRIERFEISLPADWGDGYDNVYLGCTIENQALCDARLPLFLAYPIKRRFVSCSPLLGPLDLTPYLHKIDHVTVGGEAGREARTCDLNWVLDIREQCVQAGRTFWFKTTGSHFMRDGIIENINPYKQHGIATALDLNIPNDQKPY